MSCLFFSLNCPGLSTSLSFCLTLVSLVSVTASTTLSFCSSTFLLISGAIGSTFVSSIGRVGMDCTSRYCGISRTITISSSYTWIILSFSSRMDGSNSSSDLSLFVFFISFMYLRLGIAMFLSFPTIWILLLISPRLTWSLELENMGLY